MKIYQDKIAYEMVLYGADIDNFSSGNSLVVRAEGIRIVHAGLNTNIYQYIFTYKRDPKSYNYYSNFEGYD